MVGSNEVVSIAALCPPYDISRCFKPLFCWLRLLGIELDPICDVWYKKFSFFYGLTLLLICQWASFDITVNTFSSYSSTSANSTNTSTVTYSWNVRIDHANHFCLMAIVSPAFFYVAQNRWLRLWELMQVVESTCNINHRKLRNFVLYGLIPIVMEIGIIIYNLVMFPDFSKASLYRKSVIVVAILAKIVPISAMVLFCCIVCLACLFYEEIQLDIEKNSQKVNGKLVSRWKYGLSLTSDVVDLINGSFGLILLESIIHFFIEFVARCFYLTNSISMTSISEPIAIVGIISRTILLWIIASGPSKMYRNATKAAISLRKIDTADSAVQNQVMLLALDTLHNLPKISPLGYFDIDLGIIPQLTGTTLTYLIVLYQFQSSEKKN